MGLHRIGSILWTELGGIFYAITFCVRRHLRMSKVTKINEDFQEHLNDCVLNDVAM